MIISRGTRALLVIGAAVTLVCGCAAPSAPMTTPAVVTVLAEPAIAEPEAGLAPQSSEPAPVAGAGAAISTAAVHTALAVVALLEVKGRAPKTGYERDLFGSGWVDTDRNGCDTRNDMLARDLDPETFKPGTHDCVVLTGTLADPYSGTAITFARGNDTSDDVQIDHVVALSDAWQKGAQEWDEATRIDFANNPLNLLAVDGPLNLQKSDGDAATWLPPHKPYRCAYVARQVAVKHVYGLWLTTAERDAIVGILSTCPDEPLPAGIRLPAPDPVPAPEVSPVPAPSPAPVTAAPVPAAPMPLPATTEPRFDTCKAAKAAGYGNYVAGVDPEYDWYRDADSDGIVCES